MALLITKPGATSLDLAGEKLIKGIEGLRLKPYLDSAGIATIGWGTTHYENGSMVTMKDKPVTPERAEALFQFEAKAKSYVINQALQKFHVNLTQNQFNAIVSLSYNIGVDGFLSSTLFKLIKQNPMDPKITDAIMMWNKITVNGKKVPCDGLIARRTKEAKLYFT